MIRVAKDRIRPAVTGAVAEKALESLESLESLMAFKARKAFMARKAFRIMRPVALLFVLASVLIASCARDLPDDQLLIAGALLYEQKITPRLETRILSENKDTTEAGDEILVAVRLTQKPRADVRVPLSSTDQTEGVVTPANMDFTAENWNQEQTATVTGVDDTERDGDVLYSLVPGPLESTDTFYANKTPTALGLTNTDDDTGTVELTSPTADTTEGGGTSAFTVTLNMAPSAPVFVSLASSDTTEATLSTALVTLDATNWDTGVTVTVTGQDDAVADGNISYTITVGAATSTDPRFDGYDPADIFLTNIDNESGGVAVATTDVNTLESDHGTANTSGQISVNLTTTPTADVKVCLQLSNACEAIVSTASGDAIAPDGSCSPDVPYLLFTTANATTPQVVDIKGQHDYEVGGCSGPYPDNNKTYVVDMEGQCPSCTSDNSEYNGFLSSVSFQSTDDLDHYTFITTTTHNGNFDGDASLAGVIDSDPIPEMDTMCTNSKPFTLPGTYKAMAVTGTYRSATTDWVFQPNHFYYRSDGSTLISQADASGLLPFPLTNSFGSTATTYWTGLDSTWGNSGTDCFAWSDGTNSDNGFDGKAPQTDSLSISAGTISCDLNRSLVCVQQTW